MKKFISVLIFLFLFFNSVYARELWYEDNNMGKAGGYPKDFIEKFEKTEKWKNSLKCIDVYMIRANVLTQFDENFYKKIFKPFLDNYKIKLAIDVGGATWTQYGNRMRIKEEELNLFKRLKEYNIIPCCIILQSVLDKPLKERDGKEIDYPIDRRIQDIAQYIKDVKKLFPNISVGLIDATPSHGKDYKRNYLLLVNHLKKENLKLDYILLDTTFNLLKSRKNNMSWYKAIEIEEFVKKELGLKFGVFVTSRAAGYKSNRDFFEDVSTFADCYYSAKGNSDFYIISSWFPYPDQTIPEECANDYPVMCTVLEFCNKVKHFKFNTKNLNKRCNL